MLRFGKVGYFKGERVVVWSPEGAGDLGRVQEEIQKFVPSFRCEYKVGKDEDDDRCVPLVCYQFSDTGRDHFLGIDKEFFVFTFSNKKLTRAPEMEIYESFDAILGHCCKSNSNVDYCGCAEEE